MPGDAPSSGPDRLHAQSCAHDRSRPPSPHQSNLLCRAARWSEDLVLGTRWSMPCDRPNLAQTLAMETAAAAPDPPPPDFRVFNPNHFRAASSMQTALCQALVSGKLAAFRDKYPPCPWEADAMTRRARTSPSARTYPEPSSDHPTARQRALDAYATLKEQTERRMKSYRNIRVRNFRHRRRLTPLKDTADVWTLSRRRDAPSGGHACTHVLRL